MQCPSSTTKVRTGESGCIPSEAPARSRLLRLHAILRHIVARSRVGGDPAGMLVPSRAAACQPAMLTPRRTPQVGDRHGSHAAISLRVSRNRTRVPLTRRSGHAYNRAESTECTYTRDYGIEWGRCGSSGLIGSRTGLGLGLMRENEHLTEELLTRRDVALSGGSAIGLILLALCTLLMLQTI